MTSSSHLEVRTQPQTVILRLRARLCNHRLWDALLIVVPPVLVLLGAAYFLLQGAWVGPMVASAIAIFALGLGSLAVTLHYRKRILNLTQAAQLVDQYAGAKDHFLTLATIDPANCSKSLFSRLRRDAEDLVDRVELKRDFPYKVKSPTYWSVGSSLIAVLLLYFLLPPVDAMLHPVPTSQRLRELAEKMAQAPRLKELAEELKNLAAKLEDPKVQPDEQRTVVQDLKQKIEEQQKKADEKNRDLLSQVEDELKGAERQQSGSGQERQKNQSQGSGNLQSNLPKEGEGNGNQSQGSGGDGEGKTSAQLSKDLEQGKSAQGNPKEPGPDKNQQHQGDAKGNQPDPTRGANEPNKDKAEKGQGGSKEGSGKNQASEEPLQGAPPAERFYQAGESKDGLKGARYITVQLPEDVAVDGKGESKATKEGTGNRGRSQVPVSNVPLPAHVPNAATEKQQVPIEYRGIIR